MRKTKLTYMAVFLLLPLVGLSSLCQATLIQWRVEDGGNGHWYSLTSSYCNWTDAEAEAVAIGGHLVTINDDAENAWVANFIKDSYLDVTPPETVEPSHNIAWIGLEYISGDKSLPASWRWISGEVLTFWNPETSPPFPMEGVHMYIHGMNHYHPEVWNNNLPHDGYSGIPRGVIEVVPEPAMLLLLGLGSLMLRNRRFR